MCRPKTCWDVWFLIYLVICLICSIPCAHSKSNHYVENVGGYHKILIVPWIPPMLPPESKCVNFWPSVSTLQAQSLGLDEQSADCIVRVSEKHWDWRLRCSTTCITMAIHGGRKNILEIGIPLIFPKSTFFIAGPPRIHNFRFPKTIQNPYFAKFPTPVGNVL